MTWTVHGREHGGEAETPAAAARRQATGSPKIVVAGHKSVGAADVPENLAASQRYLRDSTTVAKKGGTVEDLVHRMLELRGERAQLHTPMDLGPSRSCSTGMNRSDRATSPYGLTNQPLAPSRHFAYGRTVITASVMALEAPHGGKV